MAFIEIEIDDDETTLTQDIVDRLQSAIPGWLPIPGALLYVLAAGVAFIHGEFLDVLRRVSYAIFNVYLRDMAGIPANAATPSTASATVTSTTLTYTVDAGTLVGIDDGAGGLVVAEVVADVSTTDGEAEVQLVTQEAGAFTAGLGGPAQILDAVAYNPTVVLDDPTEGGTDGETDEEHRGRGSERLQLSSDDVITGEDAAILARQVPGVWRAMAVDNYDVATDDDAAEGRIALALQASNGGAVSTPVRAAVEALVIPSTIVGLAVGFADPDPTLVDVRFIYTTHVGYDLTDTGERAEANVAAYLASANWGSLPFGDARVWRPEPMVELLEVAEVILRTEGLDRIVPGTLEIREAAGVWGTATVALGSLPWSVAAPGTVTATVAT